FYTHSVSTPSTPPSTFDLHTLSLHDALPISARIEADDCEIMQPWPAQATSTMRSPSSRSCSVTSSPHVGFNCRDSTVASASSPLDRKSTRLNSSHVKISYAVFCLKKKNILNY